MKTTDQGHKNLQSWPIKIEVEHDKKPTTSVSVDQCRRTILFNGLAMKDLWLL